MELKTAPSKDWYIWTIVCGATPVFYERTLLEVTALFSEYDLLHLVSTEQVLGIAIQVGYQQRWRGNFAYRKPRYTEDHLLADISLWTN